jgi:hypothetical protein
MGGRGWGYCRHLCTPIAYSGPAHLPLSGVSRLAQIKGSMPSTLAGSRESVLYRHRKQKPLEDAILRSRNCQTPEIMTFQTDFKKVGSASPSLNKHRI